MTRKKLITFQGRIDLDSEAGQKIGFISSRFEEMSYLWKKGLAIYISFIASRRQRAGFFRGLCEKINSFGFVVKIPTPLMRMEQICLKSGYTMTHEANDRGDLVEVWVKKSTVDPYRIRTVKPLK